MKAWLKGSAMGAGLALAATAAFAAGSDWQVSGHDLGSQRYSPLTQINKSNVDKLQIAWTYHLTPEGYNGRPRLAEAIPIVVGNHMYISSPYGEVIALNATTGAQEWKYKLPDTDNPAERGVAYWKGDKNAPATIVFGSRMGRLYALNAKTGAVIDGFGEHGIVNLKTPEVMGTSPSYPYGQPAVPMIYKNLIITGAGTPDAAPNVGALGDTRAWDAKTGKLVWTFHTVPLPGTFGFDTWGGDSARHRAGVNVWGYSPSTRSAAFSTCRWERPTMIASAWTGPATISSVRPLWRWTPIPENIFGISRSPITISGTMTPRIRRC